MYAINVAIINTERTNKNVNKTIVIVLSAFIFNRTSLATCSVSVSERSRISGEITFKLYEISFILTMAGLCVG